MFAVGFKHLLCRVDHVLTVVLLILWWFQQVLKLDMNMDLHPEQQGHLQKDQLELPDACTQVKHGGLCEQIPGGGSHIYLLMWSMEPAQNFP